MLDEKRRGKRQDFMPVASAISAVGNRQRVSVNKDNHYCIEEVLNNNEHPGFPVIAGRL